MLEETVPRLRHVLHPGAQKRLDTHLWNKQPLVISTSAQTFREAAVAMGRGNTAEDISEFLTAQGFRCQDVDLLLKQAWVCRISVERTLKPLLKWFLDLGLTKSQFAKAVASCPKILDYSIEQNLKPTVQYFWTLG